MLRPVPPLERLSPSIEAMSRGSETIGTGVPLVWRCGVGLGDVLTVALATAVEEFVSPPPEKN
jgi:hypothetical protein